jgi:hypothetical protein
MLGARALLLQRASDGPQPVKKKRGGERPAIGVKRVLADLSVTDEPPPFLFVILSTIFESLNVVWASGVVIVTPGSCERRAQDQGGALV